MTDVRQASLQILQSGLQRSNQRNGRLGVTCLGIGGSCRQGLVVFAFDHARPSWWCLLSLALEELPTRQHIQRVLVEDRRYHALAPRCAAKVGGSFSIIAIVLRTFRRLCKRVQGRSTSYLREKVGTLLHLEHLQSQLHPAPISIGISIGSSCIHSLRAAHLFCTH